MTKLGIFGGTFNPVHNGHLRIAEVVLEKTNVDRILFIPNAHSPHKPYEDIISFEHRWNMVNLAVEGSSRFYTSDIERRLGGISYTVHTIEALKKENPKAELFLIIGSDSLVGLPGWKEPGKLALQVQFIVFPRAQADASLADRRFLERSILLETPLVPVSSSDIRSRIAQNKSIEGMVPEKVGQYIKENNLYLPN